MTASLKNTGSELIENFKEKIFQIKSTVATFFAKIETAVDENSKETKNVGK